MARGSNFGNWHFDGGGSLCTSDMNQLVSHGVLRVAPAYLQDRVLHVAHVVDDDGALEEYVTEQKCSGGVLHLQNTGSLVHDVVLVRDIDGQASDDDGEGGLALPLKRLHKNTARGE